MPDRFRSHKEGASLVLQEQEREVLVHLFSELAFLLQPEQPEPDHAADPLAAMVGIGGDDQEPDDPALARLFPSAYRDDDDSALEFRRLTQDGLRSRKTASAVAVLESLHSDSQRIVIDEQGCQSWLTSLTDLRLVLSTRLGITDDPATQEWDEQTAAVDQRAQLLAIYDWLGYLQDTLVRVLAKRLA
ncbi:MAG TPA: DUF2017 domain-containing protein [Actinobacteria bacterium]|nr:DUF2017 domain-containing protein [Actinomycetota bacterium]HCK79448.1 DUF2017 domain-containing protein [Actinomycetota bacterium]